MFDEPEARRRVDEGRAEDRHVMLIGELDEAVVILAVFGEIAANFADECARRIGLGLERVGDRADRAVAILKLLFVDLGIVDSDDKERTTNNVDSNSKPLIGLVTQACEVI